MEDISASLGDDGDPLLEFETEGPEAAIAPRKVDLIQVLDLQNAPVERPREAPPHDIVRPLEFDAGNIEFDAGIIQFDAGTIELDTHDSQRHASAAIERHVSAIERHSSNVEPDTPTVAPDTRTLAPEARIVEPAARIVEHDSGALAWLIAAHQWAAVTARRYGSTARRWLLDGGRASYRAALGLVEARQRAAATARRYGSAARVWFLTGCRASYRAAVPSIEARQRAAVTAQRYGSTARVWFLTGCRASYRSARWLADQLDTRSRAIWTRTWTASADSLVRGAVASGALASTRYQAAASAAGAMWARFQTAWQGATRASEPVPANALAIPRDVPIPTAFAACMAVATMAFLIGRLSGLPAASESHDATRPAATAPQPAVGSPYEREAFPTVAPPPEAPPSTAVTAPATAPSAADGPTRTPRVAATNSRSAPPAAAARNPDSRFRGSLAVGSAPLGAQVFVNGVLAGTTPLQLRNLPVGSRAVRIVKEGYKPWHGTVQIVSDRRTVTTASLIPLQP